MSVETDLPPPVRERMEPTCAGSTPRFAMSRAQVGILIAGWAVVLPSLFLPIRVHVNAEFWERLMDAVHLPFFATFTFFTAAVLPLPRLSALQRVLVAGGLAVMFAAAVEVIQPLTGRCESLTDFRDGVFGVALAVGGYVLWAKPGRLALRTAHALLALALIVWTLVPAYGEFQGLWWRRAHFPLLADFESPAELRLWVVSDRDDGPGQGARIAVDSHVASRGAHSLRVETGAGKDPGIRLLTGEQDWRGRRALAFDVFNPGAPFELSLRIDDDAPAQAHAERYNGAFPIGTGWRQVRIPLEEIAAGPKARPLRLGAIRRVLFFLHEPAEPRVFHLDNVRLE